MSTDLQLRAASGYGPGYVWIDAGCIWGDNAALVIKRLDSEKRQFLGALDWQDDATLLAPMAQTTEDGVTHLLLGPTICNKLQPTQWFDITVDADGQRWVHEGIIWPGSRSITNHFEPRDLPRPVVETRPPRQDKDDFLPIPPVPDLTKKPKTDILVDPEAAATPAPKAKSALPWIALASVLVLLLIGGGAYLALSMMNCTLWPFSCPVPTEQVAETPAEPTAAEATEAVTETPAPLVSPQSEDGPDQWRAIIADPQTPAETLIALGQRLRTDPADTSRMDYGYDALYAAATSRNSVAAQAIIARSNDPLNPELTGDGANPQTALTFYRMAADAGDAESAQRLAALCDWAAQLGDGVSQDLRQAKANNCN